MDNLRIIIVLWCLLCPLIGTETAKLKTCIADAKCRPIRECPTMYNRLQQGGDSPMRDLLRNMHCGWQGTDPMVCCIPTFNAIPVDIHEVQHILPNFTVCGKLNNNRIHGGETTDIDEHPWMALLRYEKLINGAQGFNCGGALISSRHVVTAGHCIKGNNINNIWKLTHVRLGEWNIATETDCSRDDCSEPVLNVPIQQIIVHEEYNPTNGNQQNDIALLKLKDEVKFTDFIRPICLPYTDEQLNETYNNREVEVAGWGQTEFKSRSNVKLKVKLPVVNNAECGEIYSVVNRVITSTQLCAGGSQGKDSCRGDSGGPLMAELPSKDRNWMIIGVVSYGPTPCGSVGWPGVYTRINHFVPWIHTQILK